MFKKAVIHYPQDQAAKEKIYKSIATLRCTEAVKYINSLDLNDSQLETLYASLSDSISEKNKSRNAYSMDGRTNGSDVPAS